MLQKPYRLKSPKLFRQAFQGLRLCSNSFFVIYALRAKQTLNLLPQFGMVVSTKIHKRATQRNRIKRRLREAIRKTILPAFAVFPYRTIVIVVRPGILEASYQQIVKTLQHCFDRSDAKRP